MLLLLFFALYLWVSSGYFFMEQLELLVWLEHTPLVWTNIQLNYTRKKHLLKLNTIPSQWSMAIQRKEKQTKTKQNNHNNACRPYKFGYVSLSITSKQYSILQHIILENGIVFGSCKFPFNQNPTVEDTVVMMMVIYWMLRNDRLPK